MNNRITAYEVAAFTDDPTAGSPTGVVLDAAHLTDEQMGHIARELNFSHTAFISETENEAGVRIRFFTPLREIKNCGHATIAAHHRRAVHRALRGSQNVIQETAFGSQTVEVHEQGGVVTIFFRQNEIRFSPVDSDTLSELLTALKLSQADLHPRYPVTLASPGENRFLLALNDPAKLNTLVPDIPALKTLCARVESIGCFVFSLDHDQLPVEAEARMFAPNIGVDEDMINGNSSGCLGAYLLRFDPAKSELNLHVHQGQTFNRPGTVLVKACRIHDRIETTIGGTAVLASTIQISL
jgi:PhzF family phenazine biosynthesis protein